ncbi:hypothetical protein H0H92_002365 [Tricholoma furcatifolium]|nr:hypothetical protein H0H92_002365 [Tricholoma furcatifolium]
MEHSKDEGAVLETIRNSNNCALSEFTCTAALTLIERAQNGLGALDDEVKGVDEELARLQFLLEDIHRRRRVKRAEVEVYGTANAPMRKLPNEILSHIFILCCSGSRISMGNHPVSQLQFILGRVCSKWRQISCSTPELWSRIQIESFDYRDLDGKAQKLRQLSKASSLSLTFQDDPWLRYGNLLRSFSPDFVRITALSFNRSPRIAKEFITLPTGSLPSLRTLELNCIAWNFKSSNLLSSPNLREFFVHKPHITNNVTCMDGLAPPLVPAYTTRPFPYISEAKNTVEPPHSYALSGKGILPC